MRRKSIYRSMNKHFNSIIHSNLIIVSTYVEIYETNGKVLSDSSNIIFMNGCMGVLTTCILEGLMVWLRVAKQAPITSENHAVS